MAPGGIELGRAWTAGELGAAFGGELDSGAGATRVARIVAPGRASEVDDLVVVTRAGLAAAAGEGPGLLLCLPGVASRLPPGRRWVHSHVMWVVAELLARDASGGPSPGVARSAVVDERARVDPSAEVRSGAVVLSGATIGPGCVIGEGAVIYGGVVLGERVVVGPNAVVGRPGFGFAHGPRGEVLRIPQRGGVVIEDDVEVGPLVTVDAGTLGPTVVRRGAKLDAHVHVAHNAEIGAGTLVAAQSGFAGSARVGARVLVGGQVGVADHVEIGEGARLAAKSGVIGDVPPGGVFAGYPAVPRGQWLRAWARLLKGGVRSLRRAGSSGGKKGDG